MNIKIIYILGTGYCGSTALEMVSGAHSKIVNVGEVNRVLLQNNKKKLDLLYDGKHKGDKNNLCSCGNFMRKCSYWKDFYDILLKNIDKSFEQKYKIHLDYFNSKFPDSIMIDSSKSLSSLQTLDDMVKEKTILPLLLIKDVRSWTTSVQKKHGGHAIKRYIRWYIEHKKFKKYIDTVEEYMQFGYEEFALLPADVLTMICDKVGLDFEDSMIYPYNNSGHSVIGNRMRYDKNKKSQIFYDYRWLKNQSLDFASFLLKNIIRFNDKEVYSNNMIENKFNY